MSLHTRDKLQKVETMSALINFHSSIADGKENGRSKKRYSPSWPPKPSANSKQHSGRKDWKVLQEKSQNGAQVKSSMPPRPSSRPPTKERRNITPKDPIWRFDEKNEVEEKKEECPSPSCHVLLTSHSFSPELSSASHRQEWQLPTQKSHRRAQSWDAGDYSFWLYSGPAEMHNGGNNSYHQNSRIDARINETNCERNKDLKGGSPAEQPRESFQQLRHAIRMARNRAMTDNSWGNYKTVAQLLRRLAGLYFENEEVMAAQAALEDALEMYNHVLVCSCGDEKDACLLDIADIICNLGSIELQYKNYELAVARFTEALDIQKGVPGHDHFKVIASLDNLGYSFSKCKSYEGALYCYKDMLNVQLLHHETFNAECYETLGKQLVMYEKLDDWRGASKAIKRALETALNQSKFSREYIDKLQRLRSKLKAKSKRWRR